VQLHGGRVAPVDMPPLPTAAHPPTPRELTVAEVQKLDEQAFQLQLAVDVETERGLLYRVIIVAEALAAVLLARQWWLALEELPW